MKQKTLSFILVLLFSLTILLFGCDDEDNNPAGNENHPPVISNLTATPTTVNAGSIVQLACMALDDDGDLLTYTWSSNEGSFPQGNIGYYVQWLAPDEVGSYSINITVSDGQEEIYQTTTIFVNNAPNLPSNPSPSDGALNVLTYTHLTWSCIDSNNHDMTYKVHFGTSQPPLYVGTVNTECYTPDTLTINTTYYWRIVADDGNGGETEGPIWSFTASILEQEFELGNSGVYITMVWIEPGTFWMGAQDDENGREWEYPRHQVTLTQGFWLGKYEVTQAQWEAITGDSPFGFYGNPEYPAENISHNDITSDFLPELNSIYEGNPWRLPTEAEWEYACRAGVDDEWFFWGSTYSDLFEYAWFGDCNCNSPMNVGQRIPNPWGLYDMSGNVWEWCLDFYYEYESSPSTDPINTTPGFFGVIRGSSWSSGRENCRSAARLPERLSMEFFDTGFRLVRNNE